MWEGEAGQIADVIDTIDYWENADFRQYTGLSLGANISKAQTN